MPGLDTYKKLMILNLLGTLKTAPIKADTAEAERQLKENQVRQIEQSNKKDQADLDKAKYDLEQKERERMVPGLGIALTPDGAKQV